MVIGRRRLGLAVALLLLIAVVISAGGTAGAAVGPIIAGPGSALGSYYTAVVISLKGQAATFRNLDPLAPHDVRSGKPPVSNGKFSSALIGFGKQTPVNGVQKLSPGTYTFFCSIHHNMRGRLIVR